jgi:predicted transcriptional regulator
MTTDVAPIVERLKGKQKELGMSDVAFAAKLGISRQLWNFIKTGKREPGFKFLKAVMRELPELTVDVMSAMKEPVSSKKEPAHET